MKILDKYIIKTFFSPFIFIFSVLFFLFIVNILWQKMAQIMGKGLSFLEISEFILYASASVIPMVLPLTILLAAIMAYGEFGERYELAAMKAAGISLTRIMAPLFVVTCLLSVILFTFQNKITPESQRKAKNMMYNISIARPALNFTSGQFINQIPGYAIKFDNIYGENEELLEGIFIRKNSGVYDNQQSIIARKGKLGKAENPNFLKLELYNGYVYEDNLRNKNDVERKKQPNQSIKFDTMTYHFDISELTKKAMEQEQIEDDYTFNSYSGIEKMVQKTKKEDNLSFQDMSSSLVSGSNYYLQEMDKKDFKNQKITAQYNLNSIKKEEKINTLSAAYSRIDMLKSDLESKQEQVQSIIKNRSKMILYQQRIVSYSITCVIFFMIGASLGSIIRKGGMGLPVVISIFIFLIFHTMNITVENLSWKGQLDPYIGAWLPNIILFILGVWLSYKALTDSQLFDIEKYKAFFKPIINKFYKPKEHSRYR